MAYWVRESKPNGRKGMEVARESIDYVVNDIRQTEFVTRESLKFKGYKSYALMLEEKTD